MRRNRWALPGIAFGLLGFSGAVIAAPEKPDNPGFDQPQAATAANWKPYEQGYQVSHEVKRFGAASAECSNATPAEKRGALRRIQLDQTIALPVFISGWSRAEQVSGGADDGYSLYVDLTYTDGSNLWGQIRPFDTGSHDWQQRTLRIFPAKPIRELTVYALFRGHSGKVWFDDFSVDSPTAGRSFDGQALAAPALPSNTTEGWFARDVTANSAVLPLEKLGLRRVPSEKGGVLREQVGDTLGRDRAVTIYYVRRFRAADAEWWNDIVDHHPARATEGTNWSEVPVGAVGAMSLYPLGCVTGKASGQAIGVPPDLGPRVVRFGYHPGSGLLYAAFDIALTAKAGDGKRTATVAVAHWPVDPAWGFRDAIRGYYGLFPQAIQKRTTTEGIWMPFTDPKTIDRVEDFGIAFHEGDNSVTSDDRLGIRSFRYTEPMTYWMSMTPTTPRTYPVALAQLQQQASGTAGTPEEQRQARAVLTSGAKDPDGKFQGEFHDTPWANGIAWVLNPNPRLPGPDTKARINFERKGADKRYTPGSDAGLDGEYLDSVESWADTPDSRPESLRLSTLPPTYTMDTHQPILPTWFSVWEYTRWLSDELHDRRKLLMGNTVPVRFFAFAPLFDVMGIETNWIDGDRWQPDDEATERLRRTLSGPKPYLLLMNTDYSKLSYDRVEAYFRQCLAWGIYPSMFSADAATNPYWESARLYNRDRPLFLKYIPQIRRLSTAGWEPIPYARADSPNIDIERFGARFLTVRNTGATPLMAKLLVNTGKLSPGSLGKQSHVEDILSHQVLWRGTLPSALPLSLAIPPQGVIVLELKQGNLTQ